MNNNTSLALIEKLITLTKNDELSWYKVNDTDFDLKPLPSSPYDDLVSIADALSHSSSLIAEHSYVSPYNNGYFFLLLYQNVFNRIIKLRIQTEESENSQIYASSSADKDNIEIAAQLKRLYNLIDQLHSSVEIDNFINKFVNHQ